jgi:hypothetical protein
MSPIKETEFVSGKMSFITKKNWHGHQQGQVWAQARHQPILVDL